MICIPLVSVVSYHNAGTYPFLKNERFDKKESLLPEIVDKVASRLTISLSLSTVASTYKFVPEHPLAKASCDGIHPPTHVKGTLC